jgi:hypothetical protein
VHGAKEGEAIGSLPLRIGVGEVLPDIPERGRPEQGVGNGVQENIGVGVAVQARLVRNLNAAENESAPVDERVNVVPKTYPHAIRDRV